MAKLLPAFDGYWTRHKPIVTGYSLVILPLVGQPQPHPYTHNTVDNKSALLLIILIPRPKNSITHVPRATMILIQNSTGLPY